MTGTLELGKDWSVVGTNGGDVVVEHLPSGTTHTLGSDGTLTSDAVSTGSLDTDEGVIRDPAIAPNAKAQGEAAIQTPPSSVSKTKLLGKGDVSWTTNDIAWGSIFPAYKYFSDPLGDYYLYYSEDHANGASIGLAYRDGDPFGQFTDYGSNPVIDSGANEETPSIVWDETNNRAVLFGHQSGAGTDQTTVGWTSSDGLSFTNQGIVFDEPPNTPGSGHTGYFCPNKWGGMFWGYHLMGSGNHPRFGISYPKDDTLLDWEVDPRPLGNSVDITQDNGRRVEWNMSNIVNIGGSPWWIGATSPFNSGGTVTGRRVAAAPLSTKRKLAHRPVTLATAGSEAFESDGLSYPRTFVDHSERRLYATYTSGGSIGGVDLGRVV